MIDISERRAAEDQLREAEERFRLIVERGPAIFYQQEFDPEDPDVSRTTYVSPQQGLLFGYSDEELLADPTLWASTIHPDDRDRVLSADVESNRNVDEQFSMEYRMISKDGRILWVQDTCSLVRVPGKPPYWQGFILDITERKQAEEQLARALEVEREATRRLRALDEMKNTFLQAVSHDLRTPLAAILGLAITLERGDVHLEEDDAKDLARRIAGNARRLDRLVTNLLDLDRLARGIVTPNLQPTDVGAVVRRVLSESELIPDTRLRADVRPVMVRADASKVERIVENLLANTVRHTPSTATIWVSVTATDEGALLAVEDDGAGVAEDIRETIFEPFQQGPDAPRHSPGVGRRADARRGASPSCTAAVRGSRIARAVAPRSGCCCRSSRRRRRGPARGYPAAVRALPRPRRSGGPRSPHRPARPRPVTRSPTPTSLKNSALTGVNCFHSPGTSSS